MNKTDEVIEQLWKDIKKKRNVIGYSGTLKPKETDGKVDKKKKSIRVYVEKKVDLEEFYNKKNNSWTNKLKRIFEGVLKFIHITPDIKVIKKDLIPDSIEDYDIDIVVSEEINALALDPKKKYRPMVAGISSIHYQGTACTINGFYKDPKTGEVYVASNNHCYDLTNKAQVGDASLQPSPRDGGKYPSDINGENCMGVPINFNGFTCPYRNLVLKIGKVLYPYQAENLVDIWMNKCKCEWKNEVLNLGKATGKRLPNMGEKLQKMGRTTGHTDHGETGDLDWNGYVGYGRGRAFFKDCILINGYKFSAGGDSGSPVFTMDMKYIGALFAGSENSTIVCKYTNIEALTGLEYLLD